MGNKWTNIIKRGTYGLGKIGPGKHRANPVWRAEIVLLDTKHSSPTPFHPLLPIVPYVMSGLFCAFHERLFICVFVMLLRDTLLFASTNPRYTPTHPTPREKIIIKNIMYLGGDPEHSQNVPERSSCYVWINIPWIFIHTVCQWVKKPTEMKTLSSSIGEMLSYTS